VADLMLDEQRVPAIEQVGDIRAAQRMQIQPGGQAERVPGFGEPPVQGAHPDPLAPLGRPQGGRVRGRAHQRAGFFDPLAQHAGQPRPDSQHAAPFRR